MKKILILIITIFAFANSQIRYSTQDVLNDVHDNTNDALQTVFVDTPEVNIVESYVNDGVFDAFITIAPPHHELHEGNHFEIAGSFSLASADTSLIVFDVADTTKYSHMLFSFDVLAATTIVISEGGAYIRAPDTLNIVNNDRNSSTVSVMDTVFAIYNDSTLISRYGTTLFTHTLGASQKTAGSLMRESELILKNDSLFVVKITSDAASNKVDYEFLWYEHISDE